MNVALTFQKKIPTRREQHTVNKALLQDGLDMLIPSTGLGYVDLDDGAVGLIG